MSRRVLIVANDAELMRELESFSHEMGFETILSPDALYGLIQAVRQQPDLILLDAGTAAIGSLEMAEVAARDNRIAAIPIIAMIAFGDCDAAEHYERVGVHWAAKRADGSIPDNLDQILSRFTCGDSRSSPVATEIASHAAASGL